MPVEKLSLGQVIDKIIEALQGLDEKARVTAITAACSQLSLESLVADKKTQPLNQGTTPVTAPSEKAPKDIRTLKVEKAPASAIEMACVVAYYLLHFAPDRKETVTTQDMNKFFVQASYPLPKTIRNLLPHAKVAGYFDSAERGAYRLNAVGHNLVAHTLPRKTKS